VKIEDEFQVDVPVDEAWNVLLDVERIAPCLPGAQLQEVEGDEYRGIVKIKVGPITAQYKGAARIVEADAANRRLVLSAEGRDTRGQGNASASITATFEAAGDGTVVKIDTDLNITGKVAQFGRGVMADVSAKLLRQFADNLRENVLSGTPTATAETPTTAAPSADASPVDAPAVDAPTAEAPALETPAAGPRRIESAEPEPVDLMDAAGGAVGKRVVPILVGLVALLALRSLRRRRKKARKARKAAKIRRQEG
jgi:carbon monoxide dehydrogenase subunit G